MSNTLKTLFLFSVLASLLVALGWVLGGMWPWILGGFALVINLGAYFWSDRIVLRMHGAQELTSEQAPALHAMVAEIAEKAGIPTPKLYRIADATPNAFATGRNPAHGVVAVTEGLERLLSPRELRGVIAHEIAHIQNRDVLIATVGAILVGAVGQVANMLQWGAILGPSSEDDEEGGVMGGLALAFVAPIAAMMLQFAVSRSREFGADAAGARLTGDGEALASALLKLEQGAAQAPPSEPTPATASLFIINPFAAGNRLARWFSTHPPTEDRVARLRVLSHRTAA